MASARGGSVLQTQRTKITEILLALAAPILISFLLYLAGSASGASYLPAITYGIGTAAGVATPPGVSCIWSTVNTGCTGLQSPTFFVLLFNGVILFIVFLVVAVQGIRLSSAALEHED